MMARDHRAVLAFVTLLGVAGCAPDSPTGPASLDVEASFDRARANQVRPSAAQVRAYWTTDRMARAVPREYIIDTNGQVLRGRAAQALRGRPPRDDSSSGEVTGASWTGGGDVMEATGRAYFTLDGVDYTCSGSIVRESDNSRIVVLTAAHCVYDEVADAFATYFAFIANYDARTAFFTAEGGCEAYPSECWVARSLVATDDWAAGDASEVAWYADFAFAVFDEAAGIDPSPGYQLATNGAPPDLASAFGYPAEQRYDGADLVYCSGPTIADPYSPSTNWGLECNMRGGSSGGPWLAGTVTATSGSSIGTIVSLVSYGYLGGPYKKYLFGPRFSALTLNALSTAIHLPAGDAEELVS